jgi:hypothetical protein
MNNVATPEALRELIRSLEERRETEFNALKGQLRLAGESLRPVNLIKSAANELTENKNLKSYLIQAGIGLAITLLTKKLFSASKENKATNLVGNFAEMGLNGLTANQAALIKTAAPILIGFIINAIRSRRKKSKEETVES